MWKEEVLSFRHLEIYVIKRVLHSLKQNDFKNETPIDTSKTRDNWYDVSSIFFNTLIKQNNIYKCTSIHVLSWIHILMTLVSRQHYIRYCHILNTVLQNPNDFLILYISFNLHHHIKSYCKMFIFTVHQTEY